MPFTKEDLLLYAVTDRSWLNGATLVEQVEASLRGGVTLLQLREKELAEDAFLAEARELKALTARYGVPLIINDAVEIALAVDADGVHVGQSDMAAGDVRARLGPHKILGVSAATVADARLAEQAGADYLGVGAVHATSTKSEAKEVSLATLKAICAAVRIPVVAIGGLNQDNLHELKGSGIAGVALVSAIYAAPDITAASQALKQLAREVVNA